MLNFKSLTGGVAAAAMVSMLGLVYAQTTTTEQPSGSTPNNTRLQSQSSQSSQPSAADSRTLPGTSPSSDNTTPSTMPSDSRPGNTLDRNFEREARADRN